MIPEDKITKTAQELTVKFIHNADLSVMESFEEAVRIGIKLEQDAIRKRYEGQRTVFVDDLISDMED